jgi:cytochrome c peroxidase|tara:strand:+ start:201 stop:1265 length:1065 start_codon:yes stop_codon:yes gene_type:complete
MTRKVLEIKVRWVSVLVGLFFLVSTPMVYGATSQVSYRPEMPLGLDDEAFKVPADNPITKEKVELGRLLFFDKRLSANNTIACASCHIPALAFTDGQPVSTGINSQQGGRSAPTAINRGFSTAQFWDGRAATLEDQSIGPFANLIEHGFASHDELIKKINSIKGYKKLFSDVYGKKKLTKENVGRAIAAFQRTLISGNSPFDRFDYDGDQKAISESAKRGKNLFFDKARCNLCHMGTNFSDEKFHNIGIGWDDSDTLDLGRYRVSKNEKDLGAFKTPTLREITKTAPYMHDGRFATLEDVIKHYNKGGVKNPFLDNQVIPLNLSDLEIKDLLSMLRSLEGEGWQHVKAPTEFPQ